MVYLKNMEIEYIFPPEMLNNVRWFHEQEYVGSGDILWEISTIVRWFDDEEYETIVGSIGRDNDECKMVS